jgi:hypothetical protein
MKIKDLFENWRSRPSPLDSYKPTLVRIAQQVYDRWDESDIDTYAGGGICHLIAEEFASFFNDRGFTAFTESSSFEQHVFTVVIVKKEPEELDEGEPPVNMDEFYNVDINPYQYESGGGFCWTKNEDVVFDASDIDISYLGSGMEWYQNFEIEYDEDNK